MHSIKPSIQSVTAFAPATCGNVVVGFDILGFAYEDIGDQVTLTRRNDDDILVESIDAKETLPMDADKNVATFVVKKFCQDLNLKIGFSIHIKKGIPLASGMGGSAASAVAALVACNEFLNQPLSKLQLLKYALLGEELASGEPHADNIVPCLLGGLTLVRAAEPIDVIQLPIPDLFCALIHPHLKVDTKQARKVLKEHILLQDYVKQSANLACFIAALFQRDNQLLRQSLADILIEPQRAHFVPGFYEVKAAALRAGALSVSFSGAGPSIFAFANSQIDAETIVNEMFLQFKKQNLNADYWISRISTKGSYVITTK